MLTDRETEPSSPEAPSGEPDGGLGNVGVETVFVCLAVAATGFLQPTIAENATIGDLAIVAVIGTFAIRLAARATAVADIARTLALPVLLITLGSLTGALAVGLAPWVVDDFVRDVYVGLTFLATIDLLRHQGPRALRAASWTLVLTVCLVSLQLLTDTGIRAAATFPNPNVAGHFLATSFIAFRVLPLPGPTRTLVSIVALAGVLATSSFGALLQIAVGLAVLAFARLRAVAARQPGIAASVVIAAGLLAVAGALMAPEVLPEETETSALSSERLDRSASGRFTTWGEGLAALDDHPLGIGAGSAGALGYLSHDGELHNEPLAYLVERGAIGLAGLIVLAVGLWRLAPPGGGARALLLGFAVSSLVRETSHYRHLWIILALVLVHERWTAARNTEASP